jgi:hypothetical protein
MAPCDSVNIISNLQDKPNKNTRRLRLLDICNKETVRYGDMLTECLNMTSKKFKSHIFKFYLQFRNKL